MSLEKLEAIIEKELANRKVYEDAAFAVKELKGFKQSVESVKSEIKKLASEKESLVSAVEALNAKKAQVEKECAELLDKAKSDADAVKQSAKDVAENVQAQAKEKLANLEAAAKVAAETLKATNDAVAVAKADLAEAQAKKEQFLKSLGA